MWEGREQADLLDYCFHEQLFTSQHVISFVTWAEIATCFINRNPHPKPTLTLPQPHPSHTPVLHLYNAWWWCKGLAACANEILLIPTPPNPPRGARGTWIFTSCRGAVSEHSTYLQRRPSIVICVYCRCRVAHVPARRAVARAVVSLPPLCRWRSARGTSASSVCPVHRRSSGDEGEVCGWGWDVEVFWRLVVSPGVNLGDNVRRSSSWAPEKCQGHQRSVRVKSFDKDRDGQSRCSVCWLWGLQRLACNSLQTFPRKQSKMSLKQINNNLMDIPPRVVEYFLHFIDIRAVPNCSHSFFLCIHRKNIYRNTSSFVLSSICVCLSKIPQKNKSTLQETLISFKKAVEGFSFFCFSSWHVSSSSNCWCWSCSAVAAKWCSFIYRPSGLHAPSN